MERSGEHFPAAVRAETRACLDFLAADDVPAALGCIRTLAELLPEVSLSSHLIGLASIRLGEPARALNAFEHAHGLAPETREHAEALGILHAKLGHVADSLYFGKLAIAATTELGLPDLLPEWLGSFADAFYRMNDAPLLREAEAHLAQGRRAAALRSYRQAREIEPRSVAAWRGFARTALGSPAHAWRPAEGLEASLVLMELPGTTAADLCLHGEMLAANGHIGDAMACFAEAITRAPEDPAIAYAPIALMARGTRPDDPALAEAASEFARRFSFPLEPRTSRPGQSPTGGPSKLRIGVIGADWGDGDWSASGGLGVVVPVLAELDPARAALVVYSADAAAGPLSRRLKGRVETWHDILALDDETLACIIANDRLDALIDLDGTIGCARPTVFSARPAPLQFSLYGVPGAVRALGFDGVLTCPDADGIGGDAGDLLVPGGLAALPADLPDTLPRAIEARHLTLGMIAGGSAALAAAPLLTALLRDLPEATLLLDPERLGGPNLAQSLIAALPPDAAARTSLAAAGQHPQDYFGQISLLLDLPDDPYPDLAIAAVGFGIPVLTCRGRQPRARLLSGWLDMMGLEDWIAADIQSLGDRARRMTSPDVLAETRKRLAAAMVDERLNGAKRQAARLVQALEARMRGVA